MSDPASFEAQLAAAMAAIGELLEALGEHHVGETCKICEGFYAPTPVPESSRRRFPS